MGSNVRESGEQCGGRVEGQCEGEWRSNMRESGGAM